MSGVGYNCERCDHHMSNSRVTFLIGNCGCVFCLSCYRIINGYPPNYEIPMEELGGHLNRCFCEQLEPENSLYTVSLDGRVIMLIRDLETLKYLAPAVRSQIKTSTLSGCGKRVRLEAVAKLAGSIP